MRRAVLLALALLWMAPRPTLAADPNRRISQYAHAAWRVQDGVLEGGPLSVAQTQDGYLWLATSTLLRFDGERFVPWTSAHGEPLPAGRLLAAQDGGLWIANPAGLRRWKNEILTSYPGGPGVVLLERRDGTIWTTRGLAPAESLCEVAEPAAHCYGLGKNSASLGPITSLIEDSHGNLWLGGTNSLGRWTNGTTTLFPLAGLESNNALGIDALAETPDGTIWVGVAKRGLGLGLERLVEGRWQAFKTPEFDGSDLQVTALHVDHEGALWIGTDSGIYRIYGNSVDHFNSARGLSGDNVTGFGSDREGNLWVTTPQGVDRFSDRPVVGFSVNEGLCAQEVDSVLASRDGSIWLGSDGALSNLRDGRVSCLRTGKELPGSQVTSLLEDHAGRLWIGLDDSLFVNEHGRLRQIRKPDGSRIGFVTGIDEDANHNVWVVAKEPARTVLRIQELEVREEYRGAQMPRRVAADPTGGVWLGLLNGDLAHYRDGQLSTYRFTHDDSARLDQLLPDADGSVLAATSFGLTGWKNGTQLTLNATNGLPCGGVTAMSYDLDGNLWLFMTCALGEVAVGDLQRWKSDPGVRVSVKTFDSVDGVIPGVGYFNVAARSPDGRLWFANGAAVQTIDPAHLHRNTVRPPVYIDSVVADRKPYAARGVVSLPPLTRDLEIDYVGLSFSAPQRVRFRYRLDGRDETWQEPGTRRQAFYTDLRPGAYHFHVIASNNDGVWNEDGATLDFVVAPAWYQTRAFLALSMLTGVVAVWLLLRLRVRQVAHALNARFEERLAERARVARDLHDTLLQTVHGSRIVADDALSRPDDADGMKHAMEQVSGWLRQASEEGRAAVNALRASITERNDLSEAFRRAIEDCRRLGSMEGSFSLSGDPREMHPVVRDEVYRIGYEAIRNACTHSAGTHLDVGLTYGDDLILRVADNGVGIDPSISHAGKDGHFGLRGMRERAARIGARFTMTTSQRSGTEIVLKVPGTVVFQKRAAGLFG
jgi:signal transduction histidine kinase/ligand-binding sensor domain-containing protein